MNSNLYVCYDIPKALQFKKMGCTLEKIHFSIYYPKYYVYFFLWDDKLNKCLEELKNKGEE